MHTCTFLDLDKDIDNENENTGAADDDNDTNDVGADSDDDDDDLNHDNMRLIMMMMRKIMILHNSTPSVILPRPDCGNARIGSCHAKIKTSETARIIFRRRGPQGQREAQRKACLRV